MTRPRCPSCPVGNDWPCPAPDCWRGIAGDTWEWTPVTTDGRKMPPVKLARGKVWPSRWGWERVHGKAGTPSGASALGPEGEAE